MIEEKNDADSFSEAEFEGVFRILGSPFGIRGGLEESLEESIDKYGKDKVCAIILSNPRFFNSMVVDASYLEILIKIFPACKEYALNKLLTELGFSARLLRDSFDVVKNIKILPESKSYILKELLNNKGFFKRIAKDDFHLQTLIEIFPEQKYVFKLMDIIDSKKPDSLSGIQNEIEFAMNKGSVSRESLRLALAFLERILNFGDIKIGQTEFSKNLVGLYDYVSKSIAGATISPGHLGQHGMFANNNIAMRLRMREMAPNLLCSSRLPSGKPLMPDESQSQAETTTSNVINNSGR